MTDHENNPHDDSGRDETSGRRDASPQRDASDVDDCAVSEPNDASQNQPPAHHTPHASADDSNDLPARPSGGGFLVGSSSMPASASAAAASADSRATVAAEIQSSLDLTEERDAAGETPVPRHVIFNPSSRELLLGWCVWLLGSWGVSLRMDVATVATRWMIFGALFGLMILWPALRLSQDAFRPNSYLDESRGGPPSRLRPSRLTPLLILRDWLSMVLVFQAVIWPLRVSAQWSIAQTVWLDGAVLGWSLLVAALVAWGCHSRLGAHRVTAMLLVMLLLFAEPLVMFIANRMTVDTPVTWTMRVSPIEAMWALTVEPIDYRPAPWTAQVTLVLIAAALAWAIILITRKLAKRPAG